MKHTIRALAVVGLVAGAALPASAQFGGLLGAAKPSASAGNIDQDVKSFLDKSATIEERLFQASTAIGMAYGSEVERAKLAELRGSVAKATDPKEAGAKRAEAIQTAQAIAQQAAASSDLEERTKTLSDAKKQLLAKGVTLFLSGALQAKDLIPTGQNVVSSAAANPMSLGKIVGVKDALPRLTNAVSFAADSAPKLVKALKGAKVKVAEVKSSAEAVPEISPAEFDA